MRDFLPRKKEYKKIEPEKCAILKILKDGRLECYGGIIVLHPGHYTVNGEIINISKTVKVNTMDELLKWKL